MFVKYGIVSLSLCAALTASAVSQTRSSAAAVSGKLPTRPREQAGAAGSSPVDAAQRAQAQALASGDAAAIDKTTRALIDEASHELGQTYLIEGNTASGMELSLENNAGQPPADAKLQLVTTLLHLGKLPEAAEQAALLTQGNPDLTAAWTLRGMVARAAGDQTGAVESFGRSLQLSPDINVAYALGAVLLQMHEEAKAERLFADIFKASDDAAIWHVAVGDAYREARYYEQAAKEFSEALRRDPKAVHAEFFLGLTYLQMNEWGPNSQSFEHLRRAIAQAPHEYVSNFYLGALESTDGSDLASSNRHLETAAAADPSQPETWIYLGLNANREHDLATAERDFRKAIELTGKDIARNNWQIRRAFFGLGRILLAEGKREEGSAMLTRYREAEQASVAASGSKIASMKSSPLQDEESAAAVAVPRPGLSDALPSASPALAVPETPTYTAAQRALLTRSEDQLKAVLGAAWNDLGVAEARQGNYSAALVSFQRAEHFGNQSPALLHNLGAAAFRLQDFAEASRALTRYAQAQRPQSATLSARELDTLRRSDLMLGFAEEQQGHFEQAAAAFAASPEAAMHDPRAAYEWAHALARTGRAKESNKIADALVESALSNEALSAVCNLYLENEDYEGTLRCFRKGYTQDPGMHLAHYQAGEALVHLDRPQDALVELRKEQAQNPGDPNIDYAVAYALLQTSDKQEAKALLTKITEAHPEQPQAQYQLGKLLLEEGETASAIPHLEASETDDATQDYVHYQLGSAYRKANRPDDAAREFKIYQTIKAGRRGTAATTTTDAR